MSDLESLSSIKIHIYLIIGLILYLAKCMQCAFKMLSMSSYSCKYCEANRVNSLFSNQYTLPASRLHSSLPVRPPHTNIDMAVRTRNILRRKIMTGRCVHPRWIRLSSLVYCPPFCITDPARYVVGVVEFQNYSRFVITATWHELPNMYHSWGQSFWSAPLSVKIHVRVLIGVLLLVFMYQSSWFGFWDSNGSHELIEGKCKEMEGGEAGIPQACRVEGLVWVVLSWQKISPWQGLHHNIRKI